MTAARIDILLVEGHDGDAELIMESMDGHARTAASTWSAMGPVMMFASSGRERDIVGSYVLGANSYVQKPGDFHQFREVVKRVWLYWVDTNQPHQALPAADWER